MTTNPANDETGADQKRRFRPVRFVRRVLTKIITQALIVVLTVFVAIFIIRAYDARTMPDLKMWHTRPPIGEFRAGMVDQGFTFDDYMSLEDHLFDQLPHYQVKHAEAPTREQFSRFEPTSRVAPDSFEHNWNRTTIHEPDEPIGGALLLHGLSDSPYSMRTIAQVMNEQGYYTVSLRVPGHGVAPAGLATIKMEDWIAATKLAATHVKEHVGADKPLVVCGYSNGGALAMNYVLESLEDSALPTPDQVYLFSPAIGITPLAFFSDWHKILSWSPYFEKLRWQAIELEFDPFKFNSFPKNAGAQIWRLTRLLHKNLARMSNSGRFGDLPPIMTFQSVVDSTVLARAVVTQLYDKLPDNGSELIVFDVNRMNVVEQLLGSQHNTLADELEARPHRTFTLTVVENISGDTPLVSATTYPPDSDTPERRELDLGWPSFVFSLSHLAVPFPIDDPVYGEESVKSHFGGPTLGSLSLRGERHVLLIPADQMLRLRYNPFHEFVVEKIAATLPGADGASADSSN